MTYKDIKQNLEVVIRNAKMILDKLDRSNLNITETRKLSLKIKRAKKILTNAEVTM